MSVAQTTLGIVHAIQKGEMIPFKCLSIHVLFRGDIQATVDVKLL